MVYGIGLFLFASRRRHTSYWRDWSSDVCSSDLSAPPCRVAPDRVLELRSGATRHGGAERDIVLAAVPGEDHGECRSEERRVGKECSSWVAPDASRKQMR